MTKKRKQRVDHRAHNKTRNCRRNHRNHPCWIEDCPETSSVPASEESSCFLVRITRVELWDDYSRYVYGTSAPSNQDEQVRSKQDGPETSTALPAPMTGSAAERGGSSIDTELTQTVHRGAAQAETDVSGATEGLSSDNTDLDTVPSLICIRRAPSARKPRTVVPLSPTFKLGHSGDGVRNPHPNVASKYWAQRRRLFSKFDDGIAMDEEGWFSVTPEAIAHHIARRMVRGSSGMVVVDAFGGVGGNTTALAQQSEVKLVVCVDTEISRLRMAANNCRVYGVEPHKVVFVHANAFDVLQAYENGQLQVTRMAERHNPAPTKVHGFELGSLNLLPDQIDAVFLSPPWGGPEFVEEAGSRGFDLSCIQMKRSVQDGDSADGEALLSTAFQSLAPSKNLAFFLPRSTNGKNLAMSAIQVGFRRGLELEENILGCKLKTLTAYFGSLQVEHVE